MSQIEKCEKKETEAKKRNCLDPKKKSYEFNETKKKENTINRGRVKRLEKDKNKWIENIL